MVSISNRLRILISSILILLPCFWHSRIHAGDLSSHVYNATLALDLQHHPVEGLSLVKQSTNVLFDLILENLIPRFGIDGAQRLAVSLCVLIFFWGAVAFIRGVSATKHWWLVPCVAMLAYGWVFHAGFFNYYLSMGLCLNALALAWRRRPAGVVCALVLLGLAWTAHTLPVLWSVAFVCAMAGARRFPRYFVATGVALLLFARWTVSARYPIYWSWKQLANVTGADQFVVFGLPHLELALALLLLWLTMLHAGTFRLFGRPEVKVLAVMAISMVVLPAAAQLEGQEVGLGFLPHRLSLTVALLVCVTIARVTVQRWQRSLLWLLLAAHAAILYIETGKLDAQESNVIAELRRLPSKQRVVIAEEAPSKRINMFTHMIDRACIDLCFSYANYEPSTLAFRVRATGPNPIVMDRYADSLAVQVGAYTVQPADLPLVQINLCPDPFALPLKVGDIAGRWQCRSR